MPPTNAQAKQQHFHPLKHHPVNINNPNPAAADVAKMELMEIYHNLRFLSGNNTRFTHPLATRLSKATAQHGNNIASVLHRDYDISHVVDPQCSVGRQFCVTSGGYMGLVPKLTRVGNEIVVLDGAQTPHVLRGIPGGEDSTLMGERMFMGLWMGRLRGSLRGGGGGSIGCNDIFCVGHVGMRRVYEITHNPGN